jgi:hypothetical protein
LFAGEKFLNENCWWYLNCEAHGHKEEFQKNNVLYDDVVYLTHQKTETTLALSNFYRSPRTSYAEGIHLHLYVFYLYSKKTTINLLININFFYSSLFSICLD